MDDALLVRRFERFGDLACNRQGLIERQPARVQQDPPYAR